MSEMKPDTRIQSISAQHHAKNGLFGLDSRVLAIGFMAMFMAGIATPVLAQTAAEGATSAQDFTSYAAGVSNNVNVLIDIFAYVSYLMGAVFAAMGISELRRIADGSGGGSVALRQPISKLVIGGMLLALPAITSVLQNTFGTTGQGQEWTAAGLFRLDVLLPSSEGSLGSMITGVSEQMKILVDVSAVMAYIIGVFFTMRGLQLLRTHIDNPGNAPLPESLKRLAVGGALFSLPFIVKVVVSSFGTEGFGYGGGTGIINTGWSSDMMASGANGGLDGMLLHFVGNIANPAYRAIEVFCFVAGVVLIFFGMQRLVRTAQDGPRGPLTLGTITMFVVAGLLISFPQLLEALNISVTGHTAALTTVGFMSETGEGDLDKAARNVMSAVLAFMAVVGFLSVVRGLFLLKTLAEGGQATLMQVTVHFVAGALCINLGALINAIQRTLGLNDFVVTFS